MSSAGTGVHLVNAPFLKAFQTLSRWGSGAKDLVAEMAPKATRR